ncbi:hypothetical protein SS50377_25563 [Spironucleus salmonicida]|uniref:Uncharacterized protein n=1 Tax=Spironucleus salmonicida TaxID=348837 RepID=V6LN27_9EUKA|nr:hypothetical protein SS50377_25563 [Spironucleus salmonicida]|eukprot:EST45111.1 Hypothetical protein SS50377_15131 [Spironucleus salmonicida]
MQSQTMLKQLGDLLAEARNTYYKLQNAQTKVSMIRQKQAQYHTTILLQKLKMSDHLDKIFSQNSQILQAIQEQKYSQHQQNNKATKYPPKPFSQNEPFRNDLTPKATVSAQPPRYKQVVPIQYV